MDKQEITAKRKAWQAIFDKYNIHKHDFNDAPYFINAQDIKEATKHFDNI